MKKRWVIRLVILALMNVNVPVGFAADCTHISGTCAWPCIPLILDKVVNTNGANAQVWFSGACSDVPDVLPLQTSCGTKYPQHWYGCWTSSGGWGSACDYECDPPY